MELIWNLFALAAAAIWSTIMLLPWRPWSPREFLDTSSAFPADDLSDITVLIPARNEAELIKITLPALSAQGKGLHIIVVDDQSTDGTAQAAREAVGENLLILPGKPPPTGWTGKLWALEQGRSHIRTPITLLLDADIEPLPGIIVELREAMKAKKVEMISLMAVLRMQTFWERLLMPAFVYFFKLLYPFRLSNSESSRVAAAAGGCIMLETGLLGEIGGFEPLRGELIDDCALARRVKSAGHSTWMGLSHSVISLRPYNGLGAIWNMVARSAFAQLHYSGLLLILCTGIMVTSFVVPVIGFLLPTTTAKLLSTIALTGMIMSYLPTLRFYKMSSWWAVLMPLIGTLYLAMTWTSALRHWLGKGSHWKGRAYSKSRESS
jgi:hopene-associated glycosyltransferase HpnB